MRGKKNCKLLKWFGDEKRNVLEVVLLSNFNPLVVGENDNVNSNVHTYIHILLYFF